MGVRKRIHGRRRHPSRCTAPLNMGSAFKSNGKPDYMSSDYKGTRTDAQAEEYMASLTSKYGQYGPKLDVPEDSPSSRDSLKQINRLPTDAEVRASKQRVETKVADEKIAKIVSKAKSAGGTIKNIMDDPHTSTIQKIQTGLTGVELMGGHPVLEVVSSGAGLANLGISALRGGYHFLKGEKELGWSNIGDAVLSGGGAVPYGGYAATLAKVGKMGKEYKAAKALDKGIEVVGGARHGQHGVSMVTGGKYSTSSILNPELTGGGVGKGSDFQKQFSTKKSNI